MTLEDANTLDYQTTETASAGSVRLGVRKLGRNESKSIIGSTLAVVIGAAYLFLILHYWAPAHPGVDQNGYLVGGKYLAETGSTGFIPNHAAGFVSPMWVRVPATGMNYPKYPNGLPLLYAMVLWIGGHEHIDWAYLVSPIGTTLGVVGVYFLSRKFAGVFASICAMLLMGFSQVTLQLANNPNSHGSCLAFCVWGVFFLLTFWQTASRWYGLLGGFLLGFALTIRYSEGLLALLIAIVAISMVRWTNWRTYFAVLWPTIGWLIPVAYLVTFNLLAMGTPTGYDSTNESKPGSAFTIEHIGSNWEKLIRQVHDTGLFFVAPLGILGMALAFRYCGRRAILLWAWFIPGLMLYMSYYWAPERGVSYLRFFMTLLPPALVGVAVLFEQVLERSRARFAFAGPIGCALITAMSCGLGAYRAVYGLEDGQESALGLESQLRINSNLAAFGHVVTKTVPAGSIVIGNQAELDHLQFVGDHYHLFSREYFTPQFVSRLRRTEETVDPEDPITTQRERRQWMLGVLEGKDEKQLIDMQLGIIRQGMTTGRRVFVTMTQAQVDNFTKQVLKPESGLAIKIRASYRDMASLTPPLENNNTEPRNQNPGNVARALQRGVARMRGVQNTWQVAEVVKSGRAVR